jgi:hypothetical protein
MALAPCRECGEQVSTEAATCPHCGVGRPARPIATPSLPNHASPDPRKRSNVIAALVGIGLAILIALVAQSGSTTSSSSSDSPVSGPAHIINKVYDWNSSSCKW